MKAGGGGMCRLALAFLGLALLARAAAPNWPGFWFLPLALGLILGALAGPARWRAELGAWAAPAGRAGAGLLAGLILSLGLALVVGRADLGPSWDFSRGRAMTLAPATLDLLARLDRPVAVTVRLDPRDPRGLRAGELLDQFRKAAGDRLSVVFLNPQLEPEQGPAGPNLAEPGTALVAAEAFRENLTEITEPALSGALTRLLRPETRLAYCLITFGEKAAQDQGPGGLSQWAHDLSGRRVMALDYYWAPGAPLPAEASVLILAGPRAPLGEEREAELAAYLKRGGRLLIMADPLTSAFSPDFWRPFGLQYPDGLVIDPETALGGTAESFIVSHDYPGHPLNRGLTRPVLWPLAGAFLADGAPDQAASSTFALAETSPSAWLETDAASVGRADYRYQKDADAPGPLALGAAVQLAGGGRLVALADSDLAANGFWGFPGNRAFSGAVVNWLLDGPAAGQPSSADAGPGQTLLMSGPAVRLAFWLPAVVWPAAVLAAWFFFYRRRRLKRP